MWYFTILIVFFLPKVFFPGKVYTALTPSISKLKKTELKKPVGAYLPLCAAAQKGKLVLDVFAAQKGKTNLPSCAAAQEDKLVFSAQKGKNDPAQ